MSVFFLILLGSTASQAQRPDYCAREKGIRVHQLTTEQQAQCPDRQVHYSFRAPANPSMPLVLYFGGGPAAPTLATSSFPVPDSMGLIRFDYPGVACNEPLLTCGDWSSLAIAELGLELRKRHPGAPLVIYGVSYGSIPASIAASLLERETELLRARVLILESAIGRAYAAGELITEYKEQWQRVVRAAPAQVRTRLSQDGAYGCSADDWGIWIERSLNIGAGPGHGHVAEEFLAQLAQRGVEVGFCAGNRAEPVTAKAKDLYKQIVCREFNSTAPDHPGTFYLKGLSLKAHAGNLCRGIALDRRYDVVQWPLRETPIVYITGMRDPATPPNQARHHQVKQSLTNRFVIEVAEGGHNPLAVTLADCAEQVFLAAVQSTSALQEALSRCSQRTQLRQLLKSNSR